VSDDSPEQSELLDLYPRKRAYESVLAVLSDDHNRQRGITGPGDVADRVLAESGIDGLAQVAVELALKLAAALERIAGDQGLAAADLAEVWFVD
jgi:hypothetical protein